MELSGKYFLFFGFSKKQKATLIKTFIPKKALLIRFCTFLCFLSFATGRFSLNKVSQRSILLTIRVYAGYICAYFI